MQLSSAPIHLVRKAYPGATEEQLGAYAREEEWIMMAFLEDGEDIAATGVSQP